MKMDCYKQKHNGLKSENIKEKMRTFLQNIIIKQQIDNPAFTINCIDLSFHFKTIHLATENHTMKLIM